MRPSTSYFGKKSQILKEKQTRDSNPIDDKNFQTSNNQFSFCWMVGLYQPQLPEQILQNWFFIHRDFVEGLRRTF